MEAKDSKSTKFQKELKEECREKLSAANERIADLESRLLCEGEGKIDSEELIVALKEAEAGLEFAGADKEIPKGDFVPSPVLALRAVRAALKRAAIVKTTTNVSWQKEHLIPTLKSIALYLAAHPDNEPDSEHADRLEDLEEIIDAFDSSPPPPMNNDKRTAEELRKQFEKETGESSNIASYTYWLEQKLLSTPSQEKVAVEFAEWIVANNYVKSGTRYTAVSWIPENGEQKTTSELYHIFLSHQQKGKK